MGLDHVIKFTRKEINDVESFATDDDYDRYNDEEIVRFRKRYYIHAFMLHRIHERNDTWCIGIVDRKTMHDLAIRMDVSDKEHSDILEFSRKWDGEGTIYYSWTQ